MVSLLALVGWATGLLALAGAVLALALLLSPELRAWPMELLERHLFPDANQVLLQHKKGASAPRPAGGRVLRILAFGDSLTEGFTSGGQSFHPYAKRLGDLMYPALPKGMHLEIEEQGESGERVLIGMKHRLARALDEHADAGRPYSWVLLLGGINDIAGDSSSAEEVLEGLDVLVRACLRHGASVLLMTLLEVAMPEPHVERERTKLNGLLKEYVAARKWQGGDAAGAGSADSEQQQQQQQQQQAPLARPPPRVELFDLSAALPYAALDEERRWELWDDGVHLSILGYEHMGELLHGALLPLVQRDLAAAGVGDDVADGVAAAGEGAKKDD